MGRFLGKEATLVLALVVVGCGDDDGNFADGGFACVENCSNPDPEDFACQDVIDGSGREASDTFLEDLDDPLAKIVLKRPGICPATLDELMTKLRLEDTSDCAGGDRAGVATRVVSERSQLLGRPELLRAVITRHCSNREDFGLSFAIDGITDITEPLPQDNVEVIAFDPRRDVFNFYSLSAQGDSNRWTFHGNSVDFISPPTGGGRSCAACHTHGGLVMRELNEPWVHWEGKATTEGARELVDRHVDLGSLSTGRDFEGTVERADAVLNRKRIDVLADNSRVEVHGGAIGPLLRPLFCATSYNLQSTGSTGTAGQGTAAVDEVRIDFLVDPMWGVTGDIAIGTGAYTTGLQQIGSQIPGIPAAVDTFFGFTFVERSASDVDYVSQLLARHIINEAFVLDVLAVDFTNPVFSSDRCGLVEFVPTFEQLFAANPDPETGQELSTAEVMRRTMIVNIEASGATAGPAVALRDNLEGSEDHRETVSAYLSACQLRAEGIGEASFVHDVLTIAARRKTLAREFAGLLDRDGVVAVDDLQPTSAVRLDPITCQRIGE